MNERKARRLAIVTRGAHGQSETGKECANGLRHPARIDVRHEIGVDDLLQRVRERRGGLEAMDEGFEGFARCRSPHRARDETERERDDAVAQRPDLRLRPRQSEHRRHRIGPHRDHLRRQQEIEGEDGVEEVSKVSDR